MSGDAQMCLNKHKWFSFTSLNCYSIVKSCHKERPMNISYFNDFTLVLSHFGEIPICKVASVHKELYSPQCSTTYYS